MIIYADTSALVKLFVIEADSEATRKTLKSAHTLGTGILTRAELAAALARAVRRGALIAAEAEKAHEQVQEIWPQWVRVAINENVVALADSVAWKYGLRGYDAVHLAAALTWKQQIECPVTLATFDQELWDAAKAAGLQVWPNSSPSQK